MARRRSPQSEGWDTRRIKECFEKIALISLVRTRILQGLKITDEFIEELSDAFGEKKLIKYLNEIYEEATKHESGLKRSAKGNSSLQKNKNS